MSDIQPRVEERSSKLYKWAGIAVIIIVVVILCISLPFIIVHEASKIMLYVLIAILLTVLSVTIGLIEWFRRKSKSRRKYIDNVYTSQTIQLRDKKKVKEPSENKRLTERTSWISWFPKKVTGNSKATAPPLETDIY